MLAALDLKTGKILWQRWIDSDVMSAPVAVDKELYVTSFAGIVYKFNQDDGKILSAVRSRADLGPGRGRQERLLHRSGPTTARARPRRRLPASIAPSGQPQFAGESRRRPLYLDAQVQAESDAEGAGDEARRGQRLRRRCPGAGQPPGRAEQHRPGQRLHHAGLPGLAAALNLGGRNFNCMGDEVVCTDPTTGKTLWKLKLEGDLKKEGGFLAAPPAAAGGQLFLATLKGDVLQMDPAEGKVVKTLQGRLPDRASSRPSRAAGSTSARRTARSSASTPATASSPAGRAGAATRATPAWDRPKEK